MSEVEIKPENIGEAIEQENSLSINKIRALFVDPGFSPIGSDDAGSASSSEKLKDGVA
jgi:hypothetical protein